MAVITVVLPLAGETRPDETPVGLERLLQGIDGVRDASINPAGGQVKLVFDDARVALDTLRMTLAEHGYPTFRPLTVEGSA